MYKRITIHVAKRLFAAGHAIYLCPCNLSPDGPWSCAALIYSKEYNIKAEMYKDNPKMWKGTVDKTAWSLMYSNWEWSNSLCAETGYYAHYYVQK